MLLWPVSPASTSCPPWPPPPPPPKTSGHHCSVKIVGFLCRAGHGKCYTGCLDRKGYHIECCAQDTLWEYTQFYQIWRPSYFGHQCFEISPVNEMCPGANLCWIAHTSDEITASQFGQNLQKRVEWGACFVNNTFILSPSLQPGLCFLVDSSQIYTLLCILAPGHIPGVHWKLILEAIAVPV